MSVLAAVIVAVVFGPSALLLAYALAVFARAAAAAINAASSTPSPTAR